MKVKLLTILAIAVFASCTKPAQFTHTDLINISRQYHLDGVAPTAMISYGFTQYKRETMRFGKLKLYSLEKYKDGTGNQIDIEYRKRSSLPSKITFRTKSKDRFKKILVGFSSNIDPLDGSSIKTELTSPGDPFYSIVYTPARIRPMLLGER